MSEEKMKLFHPNVITKQTKKKTTKKGGSKNGGQKLSDSNATKGSGNEAGSKTNAGSGEDKAG